jgi:hypothetical protein
MRVLVTRTRIREAYRLEPRRFPWLCREISEADDGSRTRDLELGKLALYQLSYVRAIGSSKPS